MGAAWPRLLPTVHASHRAERPAKALSPTPVILMSTLLSGIRIVAILAASVVLASAASAQLLPAPARPAAPAKPATIRPPTPGQTTGAPSPRAASCHNGMSFD